MAFLNEDVLKVLQKESIMDPQQRWMRSLIGDSSLIPSGNKPKSVIIREDMRSVFNTEGVVPTMKGTMQILEKLEEAGVQEAEIGYPHTKEHNEFALAAKKAGFKIKLGAHINARAKDYKQNIDLAVDNGYDMVNFVAGGDRIRTISEHGVAGSEQKLMDQVAEAIMYSKSRGIMTSAGGSSPSKLDTFVNMCKVIKEAGSDRIVIYDGRGWQMPDTIQMMVRLCRDIVGPETGIFLHCHNDFGLAVANTVMGLKAGANGADTTVNGLGHRTGNANLEQVVAATKVLADIETGIDMSKLGGICRLEEELYGIPIPKNAPITGEWIFSYLGRKIPFCLRGDWYVFENIVAEELGMKRNIIWAPTTPPGREGAIPSKLDQMGLEASDEEIDVIYEKMIEGCKNSSRGYVTDEEMAEIIHQVLGK